MCVCAHMCVCVCHSKKLKIVILGACETTYACLHARGIETMCGGWAICSMLKMTNEVLQSPMRALPGLHIEVVRYSISVALNNTLSRR